MIRAHCDAFERDAETPIRSTNVETTLMQPGDDAAVLTERYRLGQSLDGYRTHAVVGGPQEVIDAYGRLIDAGMDYIIISDGPGLAGPDILEYLGAEVLPVFR